jgi:peptide/nickel transport system substrate-binding protein
MSKKISLLVLITLFAVLVFNVNVFAQEVKVGGEIIVTDLSFKDAKTLDPHVASAAGSMRYIENMYNTLLRYEKGSYGKVEGDLVKEYEVSDDGKVYTFTLHKNIKFHNGDPLTSEDVKYSIERIIDNEVRAAHFEAMEDFEIVDDYTFKIILNKVVAPFTTFLSYPMNAIVNETVVEENGGNIDSVDAGSGPFKLVEWKKDQHLKLEKFEEYFREGLPYLNAVTLRPIPDETARTTALRNKEVDMILQVSPKEKMKLENVSGLNVVSKPGTYWEYLGLNTSGGPLANKKVRQAIAHAVDREQINKMVKFGEAVPLTGGPIPPGHWAYPDLKMYTEQNLDKSKELLNEAGYADGFELELIALPNKSQLDAAQIIKQQLAELNIDVEVRSLESSVYFNKLGSDDFEMTVIGWVGFVDPDEFLYNIFHTDEKWNQQAYSNERVDELLEEGRRTIDREKRKEIYYEAVKLIAKDAPMVFLYVNPQISAFVDAVKGFDVNPTVTTISLEETWLDR